MNLSLDMLHSLCPLHVALGADGRVVQTGPTVEKLGLGLSKGAAFLSVMEIYRPRHVSDMEGLITSAGRRLHIRRKNTDGPTLTAVFVSDGTGGGVLDLSLGIFVKDLVARHGLTSVDFSPTDLSVELLFLNEANTAAMAASRRLNDRLRTAMFAAEERALTDTLTGLANRRAMELIQARLHRANQEYALMHLDLDLFKEVNDTHGHAAGDTVLRTVSTAMLQQIRKDDTVARIGGDEFIIIFPNMMTQDRLGELADRLITRIEAPINVDGQDCSVSASIGITRCHNLKLPPDKVVEQADIALYEAKNAGRGQFAHFQYHRRTDPDPVAQTGT